jgi:type IV pilus assembly protein PilM
MSIGIDIGSKTIKVVELAGENGKFALKSASVVSYAGADMEHLTDDKDFMLVSETIKKLVKEAKISGKNVNIALPESQVFTRIVKFPLLSDQEVASAIKWEAEQYIPFPIEEAIVTHQILERRENTTPPEVLVLLVAVQRGLVDKYLKVISNAGLNCTAVETELMSMARSLAPDNQTSMIVDFGARSTDLAIVKNGMLSFSRSIATAGDALTRAVAQSFNVPVAQAEEYKRTYGLEKRQLEGKVGASLSPILKILVDEIKKAIYFYQSEEKGEMPTSLLLTGGSASLPDASLFFANNLNMEVIVANPFAKVAVDPNVAKSLSTFAPLYSIATGLAMR